MKTKDTRKESKKLPTKTAKEKKLGITAEGGSVEILKLLVKTCQ